MNNIRNNNEYRAVESMLYNYNKTKAEIKNIELDIEEEENNYCTLSAVQYDRDSLSKTYKYSSEVENKVIEVDKNNVANHTRTLQAKKRSKEIQIERIDNALTVLNRFEEDIIKLRYFKEYQFKDIADELNTSEIWILKCRRKAINKMIPILIS